ncbi:hypothetical protein RJ639_042158 [Escallonia herrerae]|uniref:Methyltransferase n=1 Tax=Escallonia herrerae TaxID=1293975 RepID=A0AA88WE46_9ASTE|nr:hypothetical protein RJ639_042158 [Escallonia herrerae]
MSRAAPCTRLAQRPRAHPAQRPRALPTGAHAPSQVHQVSRPCARQAQRPRAQLQCPRTSKANSEDLKIQACDILDILLEMHRIVRPEGAIIVRDHVDIIVKEHDVTESDSLTGSLKAKY